MDKGFRVIQKLDVIESVKEFDFYIDPDFDVYKGFNFLYNNQWYEVLSVGDRGGHSVTTNGIKEPATYFRAKRE